MLCLTLLLSVFPPPSRVPPKMEIVSTIGQPNNTVVLRGTSIFWFRFVYFSAGSTFSLNNGSDIPIVNYESVRSARGFDTVIFKGTVIAEVGRGEDDLFPGNIAGLIGNRRTFTVSGNVSLASANAIVFALTVGPTLTTKLRRITVLNVGSQTAGSFVQLALALAPAIAAIPGSSPIIGTYDGLNTLANPFSGKTFVGGNLVFGANFLAINNISLFIPAAPQVMTPIVFDFTGAGYMQPIVARQDVVDNLTASSIVFYSLNTLAGHANLTFYAEFTEEPF